MKTIKIYYDNENDVLTFKRSRHIVAPPVAVANVPEGTVRDGDCVKLPDSPWTVFTNRRVSPLELYIRAHHEWGDGLSVAVSELRGMSTFSVRGKDVPVKKKARKHEHSDRA